jgi:Domain of unknown function (DUF4124)
MYMNRFLNVVTALSAFCVLASAHAQTDNAVYRCVSDDGVPTYTNTTVGLKGCQIVSGVSVTTIPAFKPPPSTVVTVNPTVPANTTRTNTGPADFPRVDSDTQRQRDETGRRPILERELRDREERCAATRRELNTGPARLAGESDSTFGGRIVAMQTQIERCAADVAAIKRELAALK